MTVFIARKVMEDVVRYGEDEKIIACRIPLAADVRKMELSNDGYHICYQQGSGIIRAVVSGFWSSVQTDAYFATLAIYIEACRKRHEVVKVLVDRRGSPVQSREVALRMRRANEDLFDVTDGLAIVVDSKLLKMQLDRLFAHEGSKAFLSYDAALSWLLSF